MLLPGIVQGTFVHLPPTGKVFGKALGQMMADALLYYVPREDGVHMMQNAGEYPTNNMVI